MIRARSSLTGLESEYESMFELYISDAHVKLTQMFKEREIAEEVEDQDSSEPLFTDVEGEDFNFLKLMFHKSKLFNNLPSVRCMFVSSLLKITVIYSISFTFRLVGKPVRAR